MARNSLGELNDMLFQQMRDLRATSNPANLKNQIEKSKAMSQLAKAIDDNARLGLEMAKAVKGNEVGDVRLIGEEKITLLPKIKTESKVD